jgi:hypothetical protein
MTFSAHDVQRFVGPEPQVAVQNCFDLVVGWDDISSVNAYVEPVSDTMRELVELGSNPFLLDA